MHSSEEIKGEGVMSENGGENGSERKYTEHHAICFVAGEYSRKGHDPAHAEKVVEETIEPSEGLIASDETDVFEGPVARVRRSYGLTLKMAERFEMARVDVAVELPCAVNNIDEADEKARLFVSERIRAEAAEIRAHREKYGDPDR